MSYDILPHPLPHCSQATRTDFGNPPPFDSALQTSSRPQVVAVVVETVSRRRKLLRGRSRSSIYEPGPLMLGNGEECAEA